MNIDINKSPPSRADIEAAQGRAGRETEKNAALALLTPVPGLDIIAAGVTALVGYQSKVRPWQYVEQPSTWDLSVSVTVRTYVEQVKAQGRSLTATEVAALQPAYDRDASAAEWGQRGAAFARSFIRGLMK